MRCICERKNVGLRITSSFSYETAENEKVVHNVQLKEAVVDADGVIRLVKAVKEIKESFLRTPVNAYTRMLFILRSEFGFLAYKTKMLRESGFSGKNGKILI